MLSAPHEDTGKQTTLFSGVGVKEELFLSQVVGVPGLRVRGLLPGIEQDKGRDCKLSALGGTAGSRMSGLAGDNDREWWDYGTAVCRPSSLQPWPRVRAIDVQWKGYIR